MYEQTHQTINLPVRNRAFRRRFRRGASLIEIMVVLVVLLIGIFLVIRIFPTGFGVLQANANRSLAVRLADQLMSGVDGDSANLPNGVLFGYQASSGGAATQVNFATDVDPDKLGTFDPTITDNPGTSIDERENSARYNPYFSDINRFRYIKGEGVKVPLPTVSATSGFSAGSVYTCKFGPLFMDSVVGDPNNNTQSSTYLKVYGASLTSIVVNAPPIDKPDDASGGAVTARNAAGYFRTPQVYLIDSGTGEGDPVQIMFAPRAPAGRTNAYRRFTITITRVVGDTVETIEAQPYDSDAEFRGVLDSGAPKWHRLVVKDADGAPPVYIGECVTGSETVSREFDRLKITDTWDSLDPYQYKLASANVGTDTDVAGDNWANMGVLLFNPAGANYSENTVNGNRAFTAYLDYMTLDWHIIHEDREVPSTIGRTVTVGGNSADLVPVRTTLSFLKRAGDLENDGVIYSGIYGSGDTDIDVFDLSNPTGKALVQGDYQALIRNGAQANSDYFVDRDDRGGTYRTGTIYLNRSRLIRGTKLRILYKAQGDWGVSLQKAFSQYKFPSAPNTPGSFAAYPLKTQFDSAGFNPTEPTNAQIRVPFQDLKKSFVVTIQYTTQSGKVIRLAPIQMTATENDRQTADTNNYEQRYAYIDVVQYLPYLNGLSFNNPNGIPGVDQAVSWQPIVMSGVSVKTRVVYRDNDSSTDPYKVQDIDSYVTRRDQ